MVANPDVRPVDATPAAPAAPEVDVSALPSKFQPATTAPEVPVVEHASPALVSRPGPGTVRLAVHDPAVHSAPATSRQPGVQGEAHTEMKEGAVPPEMAPPAQIDPPGQARHTTGSVPWL